MRRISKYLFTIFLSLAICGCLKEEGLKRPFISYAPVEIGDNWQISLPAVENIDATKLLNIYKEFYNDERTWPVKSFLVFRNGKLVAESYLKDENDRINKSAIWSCTKQVSGIMAGFALYEGYIESVTDTIGKYIPEYIKNHRDKSQITFEDVLTMRTGISFNNDVNTDIFRKHYTANSVDYVLGLPLDHQSGTFFNYSDGDPQIFSAIIQKTTGKPLDEYCDKKFFSKIGLTNYEWKRYSDGITLGAIGLMMPPRELAKIAQCVCDSGKLNNVQVIPKTWITEMLKIRVPETQHQDIGFGYYWWISDQRNLFFMFGHGGQFAVVYPKKRLIIVITGLEQVGDQAFWYKEVLSYTDRINSFSN
jgi:CubicO group peptidase (beta-lactamase class C family)